MPRILVVEDELLISMLMQDWLQELGYEVAGPARTERAAFDYLNKGRLDAAILDIHLKDGETYGLAGALREQGVPVAFASGDGGPSAPGLREPPGAAETLRFRRDENGAWTVAGRRAGLTLKSGLIGCC